MSFKSTLATFAGKSSYWILHNIFHRGSSLPGKIALKIDPEILKEIGKNYDVIVITGTNGKTLTTALTVRLLKNKYPELITNPSGSNMEQGIVGTFLKAPKKKQKNLAILEIDEANVIKITRYIKPILFVFTNIFRDQLDRYGEIYTTYKKIIDGVKLAPNATIIANGDEPIFNSVNLPNKIIYYGFHLHPEDDNKDLKAPINTDGILCPKCQHIIHYHEIIYANLGNYFCPNCDFKRPKLNHSVNKLIQLTPKQSIFQIDNTEFTFNTGGLYNIYNVLAAYTVAKFFNIKDEIIKNILLDDKKVFGRQEVINIEDKKVTMMLIKNPVGFNQVVNTALSDSKPFTLVTLLNANYADGIDTSWIWDGNFEMLVNAKLSNGQKQIKQMILGGERYKDIVFRFKVAGQKEIIEEPKLDKIIDLIKQAPTKNIYVFATYTATLQFRNILSKYNYITEGIE